MIAQCSNLRTNLQYLYKVHFLMPFFESFKEVQIRPETVQVIVHCIEAKSSAANLFRFPNIVTFISVSVGASACDHQGWD